MKQEAETPSRPSLRVGVLLDTLTVPAWVARMLGRIEDSASADITLLVLHEGRPPDPREGEGLLARISERLLSRIEWRGTPATGSAFERRSLEDRFAHVPRMVLGDRHAAHRANHLTEREAAQIQHHDLDVLLCLKAGGVRCGTHAVAGHGAWSLVSDYGRYPPGGIAGFWEVLESKPTSGVILTRQSGGREPESILARTRTNTHPTSVAMNREELFWGALSLIPRELERLHRLGRNAFIARLEKQPKSPVHPAQEAESSQSMSVPRLVGCLLILFRKRLRRAIRYRLYEEHWHLRYAFESAPSCAFRPFKSLSPSRDRYWADPMPLFHDERWHIFFEDFRHASGQGHISVISFDENQLPQPPRDALVRPYHLSYPFVFHWDSRLWMIPETASTGAIEIYECVGFPDRWERRRRVLEDRYFVDATLKRHGNAWYLFANEVENEGASSWTEAFLYVNEGDLLDGEWKPHPANPIRSDVSCARPAGPIYQAGESLFRPAQDCRGRYGGAMAIHEISEFSPESYAERIVHRIRADWEPGLQGIHTFAHRPGLTAIDVLKEVPRSAIWGRLPDWLHRRLTPSLAVPAKDLSKTD